jgi:hypothetical protein
MSEVPGTPGETLLKAKEEEEELNAEKHGSIVGNVMRLVTEALVEGADAAQELSKHFQKPAQERWKESKRLVGHPKGNQENVNVTPRKPREFRPMAMADSNHVANTDDRRSVTGAIFAVGGTITNRISKTQGSVASSSSEAEHVAIAMAAQEARLAQRSPEEKTTCVKPAMTHKDNAGAMFLVKNQQVRQREQNMFQLAHIL